MSNPQVTFVEQDGALGVLSNPGARPPAIFGPSSSGTVNVPQSFGTVKSLAAYAGKGPAVELAARCIAVYGLPVVFCRTAAETNVGDYGAVSLAGTGTSTPAEGAEKPYDDYDVRIKIITGGTVETAGITYQWSLDSGYTYSPTTALGTADRILISDGNVGIELGAGTLVAGDIISVATQAPIPTTTEAGDALDALGASVQDWAIASAAFDVDSTMASAIDAKITGMATIGREAAWIGAFRREVVAESEATYATAFSSAFSSFSSTRGSLCYGDAITTSSVSSRQYRRPTIFQFAPLQSSLSEERNAAEVNLGALPGTALYDTNGNALAHDERVTPNGDALRAVTLRTFARAPQGIYITRPRTMAASGSDFELLPYRLVMNIAKDALRAYYTKRLSSTIYVNAKTGFIRESDAIAWERGGNNALEAALGGTRKKASGWTVSVSRTDNILSTKLINVTARIIPVGYAEYIEITIGFENPTVLAA